jgi:hypothetical protein
MDNSFRRFSFFQWITIVSQCTEDSFNSAAFTLVRVGSEFKWRSKQYEPILMANLALKRMLICGGISGLATNPSFDGGTPKKMILLLHTSKI